MTEPVVVQTTTLSLSLSLSLSLPLRSGPVFSPPLAQEDQYWKRNSGPRLCEGRAKEWEEQRVATAITAREPGGEVGVPKGKGGPFVRAPSSSACVCLSVWQPQTLSLSLSLFFSFLFFSLLFFSVCSLPRRLLPPLLLLLLCACSFGLLRTFIPQPHSVFGEARRAPPFCLCPAQTPPPLLTRVGTRCATLSLSRSPPLLCALGGASSIGTSGQSPTKLLLAPRRMLGRTVHGNRPARFLLSPRSLPWLGPWSHAEARQREQRALARSLTCAATVRRRRRCNPISRRVPGRGLCTLVCGALPLLLACRCVFLFLFQP